MTLNIFHMASYPYYAGGIDTWLNNLLHSELMSDDHIQLICFEKTLASSDTPVFSIPKNKNLEIHYVTAIQGKFSLPIKVIKLCYQLVKLMRSSKSTDINLVLSTLPLLPIIVFLVKLNLIRGKLFCSVRGQLAVDCVELGYNYIFCNLIKYLEFYGLTNCQRIFSNGWDTQQYLKSVHKLSSIVIPNGVSERFLPSRRRINDKCKIIHVGTLRPVKNIHIILQAFALIPKHERDQIELTFAGKGNIDHYSKLACSLNVDVKFLGHVNAVDALIKKYDFVVNYSGGSGVSNALIEALACGRPVVAPKKLTFEQVLTDGYNGILCEGDPVNSLCSGFRRALSEKSNFDEFLVSESVKDFRWENVVTQWMDHIG